MPRSTHSPLLAFGQVIVPAAGLLAGISTGLQKIERVIPVQNLNGAAVKATETNKAVHFTVEISADKKTFTLHAWKHTSVSNPTLIAATAAVAVDYVALGQ